MSPFGQKYSQRLRPGASIKLFMGVRAEIALARNHAYMVHLKAFQRPAESDRGVPDKEPILTKNGFHSVMSETVGGALPDWRCTLR